MAHSSSYNLFDGHSTWISVVELIHAPKPNFVFIGGWDSAVVGGGEKGEGTWKVGRMVSGEEA